MKFYRVKYTLVNKIPQYFNRTTYLFSPMQTVDEVRDYVFKYLKPENAYGFIVKDISEISQEQFAKENEENLHTMILSTIEED